MRRVGEYVSVAFLIGFISVTIWAVAGDWQHLSTVGGWFAVLGQFLAVSATLAMLCLLSALCVALLCLPLLLYFSLANPASHERLTPAAALSLSTKALSTAARRTSRWLLRFLNFLWKCVWWTWWAVRTLISDLR